ncbi:LOW QUALITY PROTEIN: hypothetical protein V2J09_006598 [Rumex salicifolius]
MKRYNQEEGINYFDTFTPVIKPTTILLRHRFDVIYVLIYVDDLTITGSNSFFIDQFVIHMNILFSLKDLGALNFSWALKFIVHHPLFYCHNYISELLDRRKMTRAKPISSPVEPGSRQHMPLADSHLYRIIVGALQNVTITRLEIAYSVNRHHWAAVKRILHYLKGTIDDSLLIHPSRDLQLICFNDVGRASDPDDCLS